MDRSTYGLSAELLASITGAHIDTARRWKRRGVLPPKAAQLIAIKLHGDLGAIAKHWQGFTLRQGKLWTPEGSSVTTGEIRAIPYRTQELEELRRALRIPQQWKLF